VAARYARRISLCKLNGTVDDLLSFHICLYGFSSQAFCPVVSSCGNEENSKYSKRIVSIILSLIRRDAISAHSILVNSNPPGLCTCKHVTNIIAPLDSDVKGWTYHIMYRYLGLMSRRVSNFARNLLSWTVEVAREHLINGQLLLHKVLLQYDGLRLQETDIVQIGFSKCHPCSICAEDLLCSNIRPLEPEFLLVRFDLDMVM